MNCQEIVVRKQTPKKQCSFGVAEESRHNNILSTSNKKKIVDRYWDNRDSWPVYKPPKLNSSLQDESALERTGSILTGFSPNSKIRIKPVTEGSEYPALCAKVSEQHGKRAEHSFSLTRSMEQVEKAMVAESSHHGRQFESVGPLPVIANGVSAANSKKEGLYSTKYKEIDRTFIEERAVSIPISERKIRQQPAIADPFYRTASSAIAPGFPNKPYTVGKGLGHTTS